MGSLSFCDGKRAALLGSLPVGARFFEKMVLTA